GSRCSTWDTTGSSISSPASPWRPSALWPSSWPGRGSGHSRVGRVGQPSAPTRGEGCPCLSSLPLQPEAAHLLREGLEAVGAEAMDGPLGELAIGAAFAGWVAGQQFDPFVDRPHGPDMEAPVAHRLDHLVVEHQVLNVGRRDDHPLAPGESGRLADLVVAFDLLRHPADRLDLAVLVDRAGDGDSL